MQKTTRRDFVKSAVAAGAAASALGPAIILADSPSRKLRHASIAVGGKGWADLHAFDSSGKAEIVAICDVDLKRRQKAVEKFPKARRYQDWRELLDKEKNNIDSVSVSTPDHMHASITIAALRMGKHVYCQKPLTHDVFEARQVAAAAKKAGVVTQLGNQYTSTIADRRTVELIRSGVIGKIRRVYMWSNKKKGNLRPEGARPKQTDPVPEHLDWEKWIGTAPMRPHVTKVYHPSVWRGWQDFGTGWLGDMGCHIVDSSYRALKLTAPISIRAQVDPVWAADAERRVETWPVEETVDYVFPGTEFTAGDTIKLTWSDGGRYPSDELRKHLDGRKYRHQGTFYIGEKGALFLKHPESVRVDLFPLAKFKGFKKPKLPKRDHYHDWVSACLSGGPTHSNFAYAAGLAQTVLLGTVALRCPDKTLQWDAEAGKITNAPEAGRFIRRKYRKGWEVPGLG